MLESSRIPIGGTSTHLHVHIRFIQLHHHVRNYKNQSITIIVIHKSFITNGEKICTSLIVVFFLPHRKNPSAEQRIICIKNRLMNIIAI